MSVSSNNPPTEVKIFQIVPPNENVETIPPVDPSAVLPNWLVLPNRGVDLALATQANRRRGLGNTSGVVAYQCRPTITGILDFSQKLHKIYYNEGCKKFYDGFNIDPEGHHEFVMALTFKVKRFGWGGDGCGILDILTDNFTNLGGRVYK